MNIIIIAIIIVILFSLGSALVGMIRGGEKGSDKMFKSLRLRISLSVFLFVMLMFASFMATLSDCYSLDIQHAFHKILPSF